MARWTSSDIPSQTGRSAVVTGAGGIGFEVAKALAKAGAEVVVASRNPQKGDAAVASLRAEAPGAVIRFEQLDLASLRSVKDFCGRLREQRSSLDILVNNAGVMTPPKRQETEDGFELQMGTNYLGHFALTAGLMPLLRRGADPRVVSLSSVAASQGQIDFDDLQASRGYKPMPVYAQSKLACLMFALDLQRRSEKAGWGVASFGAHPGISRTDLLHNAPGRWSGAGLMRSGLWFLFQPPWQGALPTLFTATAPGAKPGAYYGPDGMGEMNGYPAIARIPARALDAIAADRLWRVAEQLTGASFNA
jgi:NAD(P)-dependent dehydrogenase (short-subunit alcohol dehydrogenase family)